LQLFHWYAAFQVGPRAVGFSYSPIALNLADVGVMLYQVCLLFGYNGLVFNA
jgi:hypothetical protein